MENDPPQNSPQVLQFKDAPHGRAQVPLASSVQPDAQPQWPLWQLFEQQSVFTVHVPPVAVQLGTQLASLQCWPAGQPQTEPHTLAVGQQVPFRQVFPEQHSLSPLQVASPLGIQVTQVLLDSSQIPEQHWASLVQAPAFAIQQVPLLHDWALEQQVLPQILSLGQHDPPRQVVLPVHPAPLPQTQV